VIYRHFFWDFDGTLYDTYPRITRAFLKGLQDLGVEASYQEVYALNKRSNQACARAFAARYPSLGEEAFLAAYRRHSEEESIEEVHLYPGAREMLEAVARFGGRNYLFTHRGESLFKYLQKDGITALFTDQVTSLDGFKRKPAPDGLLYLMQKHGAEKKDSVMLGDRDIDLDAGKNAGISCALFDPENFYPDYDAPWRFCTMADMRRALVESEEKE